MAIFRSRPPLFILTGMCALLALSTRANNIQITNPTLTGNTGTTVLVQFDVTWENSWRGGATANWDAAWIFVKWKNFGNIWKHVNLSNTGFTAPAGSQVDPGLVNQSAAYDPTTNPVVGVFIYRSANGNGTFTATGVQVTWNYAAAGITYNDITKIDVFGTEMVYVPQGAFYLGDGASAGLGDVIAGQFAQGNTDTPFQITSEAALTLGGTSIANLGNHNGVGVSDDFNATTTQTLPAAFPKGFKAFYCMKYEISQGQMVDFLNSLTYAQQNGLHLIFPSTVPNSLVAPGGRCKIIVLSVGVQNTVPAQYGFSGTGAFLAHEISIYDFNIFNPGNILLAYLDWCGLRSMSELEYEKACRGPSTPLANEYAWGTTTIATSAYTINNAGTATEGIATNYSTTSGNALYFNTKYAFNTSRVGVFAANAANTGRVSSGATYYGIMEMTGNAAEMVVPVRSATDRVFTDTHGNGDLPSNGLHDVISWNIPYMERGGEVGNNTQQLRVADRSYQDQFASGHGVRTAP